MFCCCPCLHFPQATLNWESCHTKQGHPSPASSIDWLGCHSNRPGRSCLWTLTVTEDVGPLGHHNQFFSDWSDCINTHSKALPPPHTSHFGASNRQELLISTWLISSSFPLHLFKAQLRWHSSPVPYNYQSRSCILEDRKCFYRLVQKHLKPFAGQAPRKSPITLDEEIALPKLHLPSLGAYSLVWMQNIAHCNPGGCNSSLCFPTFIKTHIYSLWLARAWKWPMYSFYIDQEINALWCEEYRVTQRVYSMNA
jgi:hypothetical protein